MGFEPCVLCNAGVVVYQLSYQANWELVVMRFDYHPWNKRVREELGDNWH